jgi:hypothetical protein
VPVEPLSIPGGVVVPLSIPGGVVVPLSIAGMVTAPVSAPGLDASGVGVVPELSSELQAANTIPANVAATAPATKAILLIFMVLTPRLSICAARFA